MDTRDCIQTSTAIAMPIKQGERGELELFGSFGIRHWALGIQHWAFGIGHWAIENRQPDLPGELGQ